jgi:hypothetical protein
MEKSEVETERQHVSDAAREACDAVSGGRPSESFYDFGKIVWCTSKRDDDPRSRNLLTIATSTDPRFGTR